MSFKTKVFVLIILNFVFSCNKEKERLKLNLRVGDKQTIVSKSIIDAGGFSIETTHEIVFDLLNISDSGVYELNTRIVNTESVSDFNNSNTNYNTTGDTSNLNDSEKKVHEAISNFLNKDYKFLINKNGEIIEHFKASDGTYLNSIEMDKIQIIFPEKEVGIGDEWENTVKLQFTVKKSTYRIKNISQDKIYIDVNSVTPMVFFKQKTKGEYVLDKKTKRLLEANLESNMVGNGKAVYKIYEKDFSTLSKK
ncbi:MAG: hypothetical protein K8R54_08875 [Bacteroidales bacterium]|nr:hypothetical protein [Bacteroidales bacterium]